MALAIFPEGTQNPSGLTLETVAAKLTYFHEQLHLIHWQTTSFAEHQAVGSLYNFVHSFKDDVIEKLMGYTGKRIKAFKIEPLVDNASCVGVVQELITFAYSLIEWAEANRYCDVENLAQSLSGEAAKTKYLLTLK